MALRCHFPELSWLGGTVGCRWPRRPRRPRSSSTPIVTASRPSRPRHTTASRRHPRGR